MSIFFSDVFIKQIDKGVPCISQFSCSDLESKQTCQNWTGNRRYIGFVTLFHISALHIYLYIFVDLGLLELDQQHFI